MSSAHCTQHPVLPKDQLLYLMDLILNHAEDMDFEVRKSTLMRFIRLVTDDFNEIFEGKCTPDSSELETKKTAKMLYCALMENIDELEMELAIASDVFWSEKLEAEGETMRRVLERRGQISG